MNVMIMQVQESNKSLVFNGISFHRFHFTVSTVI